MQRLFSMFPGGAPGSALLILRFSVAAGILLEKGLSEAVVAGTIELALRTVLVVAVLVGFCSPIAAVFAFGLSLFVATAAAPQCASLALLTGCNAAALGLIGPGAFSIDARLFGRRVLVLPDKER